MSEIDIILNTDIRNNGSSDVLRNDKIIFFNDINSEGKLFKNNFELESFIYGDDFLDYIENLTNRNTANTLFAKKDNIKRLLEYVNPIVDIESLQGKGQKYGNIIIDKNNISIPYMIESSIRGKKKNYNVPANTQFKLLGLYSKPVLSLNNRNQFYHYITNILPKSKYLIHTSEYNNKCSYSKEFNYNCLTSIEPMLISKILSAFKNIELSWKDVDVLINNIYNVGLEKAYKTLLPELPSIINTYNDFLIHKIPNMFTENIYSSFYLDDKKELYEDIMVYSLDDSKVKSRINSIRHYNSESKKYIAELQLIDKQKSTLSKLEYITKTKFSNLFNPNSKEYLFDINNFNIDKIPKKIRDVIIIEYKKNIEYSNNIIFNKCSHIQVLNKFNTVKNEDEKRNTWFDLLKYINKFSEENEMLKCNICSYNIICQHSMEYYSLTFSKRNEEKADLVHNIILNKFMSKSPINFIYYCKICGEELGKSSDMEGITRDNESYNESSNTDMYKMIMYLIYSTIKFNNINIKMTKKQIIEFILGTIEGFINNIEKKLLKSKQINIDKIVSLNTIIFTYACIISLSKTHTYIDIFNPSDKGIIRQKIGSLQQKFDIRSKFVNAYNVILARHNKILFDLGYTSRLESVKELLLKAYTLVDPIITENKLDMDFKLSGDLIDKIILNSNIYNYFYNVKCMYPLLSTTGQSTNNQIAYNDINSILTNYESKLIKKESNIWNNFNIPNFSKSVSLTLDKMVEITSFSEYKYYSVLLVIYFIQNDLFRSSPYHDLTEEKYNFYHSKVKIIKDYETMLKDNNTIKYLYPYSQSILSNSRYFYKSDINLGPFICLKTGHLHIFNNYVFIINGKEEVFNKKELDENIEIIVSSEFKDYKCSECNKHKNENFNADINNQIEERINFKNNISNFYNIYKYKCPKGVYHKFILSKGEYICSECNIKFLEILNEEEHIYTKFRKEYEEYMKSITENKNIEIQKNKTETYKLYSENIINLYGKDFSQNEYTSFLKKIENIKLIDLEDELSVIANVDRKRIKLIGDTEGFTEDELLEKKSDYYLINNLFMKISEHIRTISIYFNILTSKKKITDYDIFMSNEFIETYNKLKNVKINNYSSLNINSLYNFLRLTMTENSKIIELGKKILFSFILFIYKDNRELKPFVEFCINNILLTDILYTKFDYSQLKQMFIDSSGMDDTDDMIDDYEDYDNEDLFEYEDLSMNNMADDDIED